MTEVDRLTMDEVKVIEDKQSRMLLIGGLTIVSGIVVSLLAGWLIDNVLVATITLVSMMIVGAVVMISAPSVYQCQRCGEYYTAWWRHPEDVCLCNLKIKLSKLECKNEKI
jgi:undecaprenyl pyrophosphate phosphatase UppP